MRQWIYGPDAFYDTSTDLGSLEFGGGKSPRIKVENTELTVPVVRYVYEKYKDDPTMTEAWKHLKGSSGQFKMSYWYPLASLWQGNHIEAELDAYGERNAFMITSETATDNVELLIKEVYNEIERLLTEPVGSAEIELVRNYIMGELCCEYEGQSSKSEVFINTLLSGAGFASVNKYIDEIKTVTPEDLHRLACEYFHKDRMIEIVVGA